MVLYKATKDGNVPMTAEEEADLREDWAKDNIKPKRKTTEERLIDLENRVLKMESKK